MSSSARSYTSSSSRSSVSGFSSISSNTHDAVQDRNMQFIWWIANRLTSYDEEMHKEILDDFFMPDAKYIHPALTIEGRYNIRKVFRVWTSLNKDEPEVTNIVFDNILGTVLTSAGGFLHTANQTTGYLQFRAEEVQKLSTEIIEKSSAEIQSRSKEMTLKAHTMVDQAKDTVEKRVASAREEVEKMRQLMRPTGNPKAITGKDAA
ncbi:hypothetical protein BGZ59_003108 [Podila verticillata]|nr:hypothetical protein BGZ59_003108 [Podila verticillata]